MGMIRVVRRRDGTTAITGINDSDLRYWAMAARAAQRECDGRPEMEGMAEQAKNLAHFFTDAANASYPRDRLYMAGQSDPLDNYLLPRDCLANREARGLS